MVTFDSHSSVMRDQQQQMEFSTRKKGPKPKLRGTQSVPVSPSSGDSWRQARNRPVTGSLPIVPQPYLTPISTKKSDIDTEKVCISSQVPVRHIPPPKFLQPPCVSSQVPVRHIPPPKFLPPQRKPIEIDSGRKVARSHSVLNVKRRRDLAYLVVDLQPGASSNPCPMSDHEQPPLPRRSPRQPMRSNTMSSFDRKKPTPTPRHKAGSPPRKDPNSSLPTQDKTQPTDTHTSSPPTKRPIPAPRRNIRSSPPSSSAHEEETSNQPRRASPTPLSRSTSVPGGPFLPGTLTERREHAAGAISKPDTTPVSVSKSPQSKPKPPRPPQPSPVLLEKVKDHRARYAATSSSLYYVGDYSPTAVRRQEQHKYEEVDLLDSNETRPPLNSLNRSVTDSSQTSKSSRTSNPYATCPTLPNGTSPASLLSTTDSHSQQFEDSIYEPVDVNAPLALPRHKLSLKKAKHTPVIDKLKSGDTPPKIPPKGSESNSLPRRPKRVAPPPPIPQKSELARAIGAKVNASRDAKLQPFVERKVSEVGDGEEDTAEDVYIVPGEPDIGGVDEYVDMNPLNAWEQQSMSAGVTHVTAEELAADRCEESYVEMHPATTMSTSLPPTEEEEEEEEDRPEEVYIEMDPTEYIPPPTLFYDKAELKAEKKQKWKSKT